MPAEPESSRVAESQEQSSRGPRLGLITALAIFAGVVIVIIYGYLARPGRIGVSGKQFWDYLDLLIVPAALALGVYWLNRRQTERDQQAEVAQQEQALAVESQRAQDEALQGYLDQIAQLLIEKPLRQASPGDDLSTVARARTLTVLSRLDGERKGSVLQFLYESGLISKGCVVIDLSGANLRQANLSRANMHGVCLRHTNLRKAKLNLADLEDADLHGVDLREADMSDDYVGEDLAYIGFPLNLRKADLSSATLLEANLSGADLRRANLTKAGLSADLSNTNLSGARGVTAEELDQQAKSLEGATMPDGQKYEDWLKDKMAREDDGKNDGSS